MFTIVHYFLDALAIPLVPQFKNGEERIHPRCL